MPVYEAICRDCEVTAEYLRPVAECMHTPSCPTCGEPMHKVILTAAKGFVKGKFEPFKSTVDGSVITCERELRAHNERNNVVSLAEGYTTEELMTVKPKEEVLDKKELVSDIAEATHKVAQGYKPLIEVQDGN
jgi:putative FmdB family regulatory protein